MGGWLNKLYIFSMQWNYDAAVKKNELVLFIKIQRSLIRMSDEKMSERIEKYPFWGEKWGMDRYQ